MQFTRIIKNNFILEFTVMNNVTTNTSLHLEKEAKQVWLGEVLVINP